MFKVAGSRLPWKSLNASRWTSPTLSLPRSWNCTCTSSSSDDAPPITAALATPPPVTANGATSTAARPLATSASRTDRVRIFRDRNDRDRFAPLGWTGTDRFTRMPFAEGVTYRGDRCRSVRTPRHDEQNMAGRTSGNAHHTAS